MVWVVVVVVVMVVVGKALKDWWRMSSDEMVDVMLHPFPTQTWFAGQDANLSWSAWAGVLHQNVACVFSTDALPLPPTKTD